MEDKEKRKGRGGHAILSSLSLSLFLSPSLFSLFSSVPPLPFLFFSFPRVGRGGRGKRERRERAETQPTCCWEGEPRQALVRKI
jgi:hypothetical protein